MNSLMTGTEKASSGKVLYRDLIIMDRFWKRRTGRDLLQKFASQQHRPGTDADGRFLFREPKSGKYELVAESGKAFVPFRSPITLAKPKKKCRREFVIRTVLEYPDNCRRYVMKR